MSVGTVKIRSYEKGLVFKDREFQGILGEGRHWFFEPLNSVRVKVVSQRDPWLEHSELDVIVKSDALGDAARVIDLKDNQRALVWIDGRFDRILGAGLYAIWTDEKSVSVEVVSTDVELFEHKDFNVIVRSAGSGSFLDAFEIQDGHKGVLFRDGEMIRTLGPGRYASWKQSAKVKVSSRDIREKTLDVAGQELMTSDKVTLRMNVVAAYRIVDLEKALRAVSDVEQALYREVQLALRTEIGSRELDLLLSDKYAVAQAMGKTIAERASLMGVEVLSLGIKDIILPGDMKALLNQVIEARKASEANAITRREETASMRSQLNTAKLMESNAVLMRLRELEVLERVAANSTLHIVSGEKGITQQMLSLV
jgi:transcriptional regulator NrdR family protein